jgi:hypothetical protein
MDIIVNGRAIAAPHIEGDTWLSNPRRAPHVTDGNAREPDEAVAMLWHTTSGRLVTELQAEGIPSTDAEKLAHYQTRTPTQGLVALHRRHRRDRAAAGRPRALDLLARRLGELLDGGRRARAARRRAPRAHCAADQGRRGPHRDPLRRDGHPPRRARRRERRAVAQARAAAPLAARDRQGRALVAGLGQSWSGVIGHCHVAPSHHRGPGDPGPLVFVELLRRGFEGCVVRADGTIADGAAG